MGQGFPHPYPREFSSAIMNDPHSLPDNGTTKTEGGFLFDDWDLSEGNNPTESITPFDGKIIARMPDLGSESIAKNIGKPKFPTFWGQACASVLSVLQRGTIANIETEQRFFHRVTVFGGIVLLCGIGILLISSGKDSQVENAIDLAQILAEKTEFAATESVVFVAESAFSPILQPEPSSAVSSIASNSTIPVAPVESVAAVSPPEQVSPWSRPAADSYSPWEVTSKQPENSFHPIGVVSDNTAPVSQPEIVAMSPMTPIAATSMPVSPHEMSATPFGQQLVAQSNPPYYPPVGTQIQPSQPVVPPGMIPTHGRQENALGGAPQQSPQWHPSAPQRFPTTTPGHAVPINNPQGQFGQQSQHVAPPGYMLPNNHTTPAGTPIPSGISTLPQQGGQQIQPHGTPVPRPPNDFYNNPPPTSRWM